MKLKSPEKFLSEIKVDKVILMNVILLVMYSILAIFSATSGKVYQRGGSRIAMLIGQEAIVISVFVVIFFICKAFKNIKPIRKLSKAGFAISLVTLLILVLPTDDVPLIHRASINGEYRFIKIYKLNILASEVVKVSIVAYIAWAMHALKNGGTRLADRLAKSHPFFAREFGRNLLYIGIPMGVVALLSMTTGVTNGLFVTAIMFGSILAGGFSKKDIAIYIAIATAFLLLGWAVYKATDSPKPGKVHETLSRLYGRADSTGSKRVYRWLTPLEKQIQERSETESVSAVISANEHLKGFVAIHEGGLVGKGPGNSTQKYEFYNMFSDYVFSFLCEEYGIIFGGLPLLLIFISILARGAIIARNCENMFARVIVSGYSLLLSGQGLLHIAVNVGLLPTTGQTLPLVSDGKGSAIMFAIAFGVLLFISKEARKNIEKQEAETPSLIQETTDEEAAAIIQESEEIYG
ncbi:MAG: FtsW/RodA/SpoVE family cell cycle protein [Bacteroidales bacterium]|nr:FtsW/RodA/SpoVE family cell cycle protein [Bacteroidales bacterium]